MSFHAYLRKLKSVSGGGKFSELRSVHTSRLQCCSAISFCAFTLDVICCTQYSIYPDTMLDNWPGDMTSAVTAKQGEKVAKRRAGGLGRCR